MDMNELLDFGLNPKDIEFIDSVVNTVGKQAKIENSKDAILNPKRVKDLLLAYEILKHLMMKTKAKVTYEMNEPYTSMGSVKVTGKNLTFNSPKLFMVAVKLASNVNVYPKVNGTVQMDFTFHNLTTTIE